MAERGSDSDLAGAQGKLVMFLASLLARAGVVETAEFGQLLAVFADTVAEEDPGEGEILSRWATVVKAMSPH